jgi:hypothetical protein
MIYAPANSNYPQVKRWGAVRIHYSTRNLEKPYKTKRYMIVMSLCRIDLEKVSGFFTFFRNPETLIKKY